MNFPRKMFVVEQVLGISILVENIDIVNRKQIFIVVTQIHITNICCLGQRFSKVKYSKPKMKFKKFENEFGFWSWIDGINILNK